jgi:AcrR family transcriptional regulator
MRARLLDAVLACSARAGTRVTRVDDVVSQSGVSRATFYNYFGSLDEAANELGDRLAAEMVDSLRVLFADFDDGLTMVSTGLAVFLMRGATDPVWAGFVARVASSTRDVELLQGVAEHLELARRQGTVDVTSIAAAHVLVVGTLKEALRRMASDDGSSREVVQEITTMVIAGLGVTLTRARAIARSRIDALLAQGPLVLSWWRQPWA